MAHNPAEVAVGGIVLAVAAGFLLHAGSMTGLGAGRGGYELVASFRSAEGLAVGTDVRLAGVRIGAVTGMELDPATFRAVARFRVRDGLDLPEDSLAAVASEGLLGGPFLEIVPGGSPMSLAPGEEVLDTQSAVSLVTLLLRFVTAEGGDGAAAGAGAGKAGE